MLDYRILSDNADISSFFGRGITPPCGVDEGEEGSCNYVDVFDEQGNAKACFSRTSRYPLEKGDLLRLVTGNGGGWGNPRNRPKAKVQNDIKNGFITVQEAQSIYNFK